MKKQILLPLAAALTASAYAGPAPVVAAETSSIDDWFKFSFNARARIEQRHEQGKDNSWAGTVRIRPGLMVGKEEGLSAFIESEHTLAFIDETREP